jgi:hypothetical protein
MAALPDSVAALKDISDARIKSVDADVSAFAVAVNALAGELRASIIDLSSKLTADNAAAAQSLVNLQKAVQAQINKLDYAGVVKDFIGTYGDTEQYALDTLKALKVEPKRLAPVDQRALANLAAQDYQYLDGLGTAAIQAVTSGVVRNTLLGRPRSEIIQRISDTLDLKLRNYAVTYADTALASYDRASSSKLWTAAGLTMFVYRGPKDIKNRPFCDHHVGKTYSLDEINGKLNDELKTYSDKPLLPCLVYGGGWNCRHVWSPVPSKEPKTSKIFAAPLVDHAAIAKQEALDKAAKADAAALLKKAQDEADAAAADAAEQNAAHEKKVEIAELINSHVQDLKTKLQTLAKLQAQQAAAAQAAKEADDKAALQKKIELSQILKAHVADLQQQLADQAALDQEKAAAEEKAHHAALLANAENPNQMIETLDVAGEKIHTVQGKNYSSKGAAYNYASKVFQEAHPDLYAANLAAKAAKAVPAVPPSPAPPEPAKVPGAKIPDGMAASYVNGAGNVFPPVAPAPAAVPAAPRGPSTAEQGQDVGTVARQALAAGVQGKVYKMDADTIEDQAALMWRETVGSRNSLDWATSWKPRIVIRGKLRPEGETDLVKGFERFAADGGVDVLKPATIDIRALSKGQTRVTQADAPIDKLPGASGSPPQYSADLGDGVSLKYFPFKQRAAVVEHKLSDEMMAAGAPSWMQEAGSDMPYALRGTWEIHIDEAAAAANEGAIERALNKAAALGLDTRPATRADEEAMYLRKQAYILKLHDTPEWKAVEKSVARKVPAQQAAAMREFWAQRLNVKDLAALEQYEPSGSYERNFLRPGDDPVGYRLQYRFDLSDADVEREMKGYTLSHFLTNAKGGVPAFLKQIMESNGSMTATVEKNRIGVPIRGMSPSQDLGTGGGSYFFTRILPETQVAGQVGLEFKKTLLRRMDAISYGSDKYGRVTGSTVETDRGSTPAEWQRFSRTGSNETIFKNAVSIPDWIQRVKVSGEVERQAAIEVFKSHGLSVFPDGRPVEDVVVNVQAYKPAPPPPAKPPSEPANTAKQSKADFDAAAGKKLPPTIKVDGTTYFYQAGSGKYEYKGSSKKGLAPIDPKYVEASAMKAAKEYYQIQ